MLMKCLEQGSAQRTSSVNVGPLSYFVVEESRGAGRLRNCPEPRSRESWSRDSSAGLLTPDTPVQPQSSLKRPLSFKKITEFIDLTLITKLT